MTSSSIARTVSQPAFGPLVEHCDHCPDDLQVAAVLKLASYATVSTKHITLDVRAYSLVKTRPNRR